MKEITALEMEQVSGSGIVDLLNGTQGFLQGVVDTTLGAILGVSRLC